MCGEAENFRETDRREQTNTNMTETKPMIETPAAPQYVVTVEENDPCVDLHEDELEPVSR